MGYFTGLVVKRFGVRILGSAFAGWGTNYMGFNMVPGASRVAALAGLTKFAFRDLNCWHIEIGDRYLTREDGRAHGFLSHDDDWYELDLTPAEDVILTGMSRMRKANIRRAERDGVIVQEAQDLGFASDYYEQLLEVFAHQRLVPTVTRSRVEQLIQHLSPTGNLLMLRALTPAGSCMATGLWLGFNKRVVFWGSASLRANRSLRPNEALHWHAIRYWKKRGMIVLDWGGGAYKANYGGAPLVHSQLVKSRSRVIQTLRNGARLAYGLRQRALGQFIPRVPDEHE